MKLRTWQVRTSFAWKVEKDTHTSCQLVETFSLNKMWTMYLCCNLAWKQYALLPSRESKAKGLHIHYWPLCLLKNFALSSYSHTKRVSSPPNPHQWQLTCKPIAIHLVFVMSIPHKSQELTTSPISKSPCILEIDPRRLPEISPSKLKSENSLHWFCSQLQIRICGCMHQDSLTTQGSILSVDGQKYTQS